MEQRRAQRSRTAYRRATSAAAAAAPCSKLSSSSGTPLGSPPPTAGANACRWTSPPTPTRSPGSTSMTTSTTARLPGAGCSARHAKEVKEGDRSTRGLADLRRHLAGDAADRRAVRARRRRGRPEIPRSAAPLRASRPGLAVRRDRRGQWMVRGRTRLGMRPPQHRIGRPSSMTAKERAPATPAAASTDPAASARPTVSKPSSRSSRRPS